MPNIKDTMVTAGKWAQKNAQRFNPNATRKTVSWEDAKKALGEFGRSNLGQEVATGLTAAAPAITGGNHMMAGDGLMGLGAVAGMVNPWLGLAVTAGGTLMNAAFGSNVNQQAVKEYEDKLVDYSRPEITAQDNTQLVNQINSFKDFGHINKADFGTQGWFNTDVDYAINNLMQGVNAANASRARLVDDAVTNVDKQNDARIAMNYRAFGGPLSGLDPFLKKKFPDEPSLQQQMEYNIARDFMPDLPDFYPSDFKSRVEAQRVINAEKSRRAFAKRMQEREAREQRVLEKLDEFDNKYLGNRFIRQYDSGLNKGSLYTRAFGGPIFGYMSDGAIAYDMARDNLMAKMWNVQNKSQGSPSTNVFDKGGPLFDYDLGISLINAGGSHEKNPFGGVPMGKAPDGEDNVVEEGESIFKDYVFSKRLPVPKAIRNKYKMRSTNFSDMFKEYLKKNGIDERENDPIAQNGLMAFASDLMVSQEMVRAKRNKNEDSRMAAYGGHLFGDGSKIIHDPSKTKENYFNDLYAEGSDYMNAINWYNDPAHTKERDALIAAINAGNFDTDIEKINGYTVTPDNWYALATDYKKGPVHNAILNRMNTIKRMGLMTPIGIPDEVNPIMKMGPDGKYELGYGPWTGKGGPQGLIGVPPMDGGASGNGNGNGAGDGALSVTSPYSKIGNRARMAGLFANVGALTYNMLDPYRPRVLDEISDFTPISGTPIGEYAPIFHTDTRYNSNQLAQQVAATRAAIMNTTNPNRNAGLLVADYNAQVAQGDVLRKDAIADYENLLKTLAFNRETSKYNSGLDLDVAKANMSGRQAHDSAKLQQEQYNVTNYDSYKRAKDAAFAQGISNIVDWFNANNRERDNLAMVGALRDSGALASNDAMDLLYNYLAGVKPAKTKSKNGKK